MSDPTPSRREDPLLVHARREAIIALGLWVVALLWTVGYCSQYGYQATIAAPVAERPSTAGEGQTVGPPLVLGVPSWVMWGVFVPWTICTVISTVLATSFIRDADLGEDPEEVRSEHEAAREIGDA